MSQSVGGLIDIHAHCVPRSLFEHMESEGAHFGVSVEREEGGQVSWNFGPRTRTAPIDPLLVDLPERIARMDRGDVEMQLLSSFIDIGAHHVAPRHAAEYARLFNDELAAVVAAHPARLRGLATLPTQDPEAAAAELERAVWVHGFAGAELSALATADLALEPLWAVAEQLRALILVHPEASTRSPLPYFLGNFVGNPYETTVAAATLIMSGTLERHPGLALVLVHGGGFLPYQVGRLDKGFAAYGARFGARLTVSPREQVRRMYYDTVLHDPVMVERLVSVVGAERVVLGTDYPFAMGDSDAGGTLASLNGVPAGERDLIRAGNMRRLLAEVGGHTPGAGHSVRR